MKTVLLYLGWIFPAVLGTLWWSPLFLVWLTVPVFIMMYVAYKIMTDDIDPNGSIVWFFYYFQSMPVPDKIPLSAVPEKVLGLVWSLTIAPILTFLIIIYWSIFEPKDFERSLKTTLINFWCFLKRSFISIGKTVLKAYAH